MKPPIVHEAIGKEIIGKTVTGICVINADGLEVDNYEITFSDGSKLSFHNEYWEGWGWSKIGVRYESK